MTKNTNLTKLSFAEETSLKNLPVTPVWYELEPNSYSDFGSNLSNVMRNPISEDRQRQKGSISDLDCSGGFNSDLTKSNLHRLMQGFFFANLREKFSTTPVNGTKIPITDVDADSFNAASGLDSFVAGDLVLASGFGDAANNGLAKVTAALAGAVTVDKTLVVEASPPANAKVEVCGVEAGSGDLTLTATASGITIGSTSLDFTTLNLNVGEWIFIGGDAAGQQFALNDPGYGRIKSISANALVFDETTFTAVDTNGAGKTIRLFFGNVLRNEKTSSLIVRKSYNLERQLGNDGVDIQSEYLEGSIPNEIQISMPQTSKATVDMSFVAMDHVVRTGTEDIKTGTRVEAPGETAFNTSSDVYRSRIAIYDPADINKAALFAYLMEANITINNNITAQKALGVLGAIEGSPGDFEVSGSITAFFDTVDAITAVRASYDVGIDFILAHRNTAVVIDMPLVSLTANTLNAEKDQTIKIPIEAGAGECANGYTALVSFLPYVPTVGMPS